MSPSLTVKELIKLVKNTFKDEAYAAFEHAVT